MKTGDDVKVRWRLHKYDKDRHTITFWREGGGGVRYEDVDVDFYQETVNITKHFGDHEWDSGTCKSFKELGLTKEQAQESDGASAMFLAILDYMKRL